MIFVVHFRADRRKATVVSIPRDTLVTPPKCNSKVTYPQIPSASRRPVNEALGVGGPLCAVRSIEALSGLRMDHFIQVDFTGFRKVVDALGGIEVTTNQPIHDLKGSHLNLDAGKHHLNGEQALGFVRTRKSVGDGSDLGRIQLQQEFIRQTLRKIHDLHVLTDPFKIIQVANITMQAITADSGLASLSQLLSLAKDAANIDQKNIRTVTLPVAPDRKDVNRVTPVDAARRMWQALKSDTDIPPDVMAIIASQTVRNPVVSSPD
ncbi:LCP family protein [Streptomyces noursei]|uniref:LCP family protein n=1 Tax=Streptomyces noursei TaxID=1971 RepID=UPI0021551B8B|nr:LCP family protein [Streptomyces noursei]